MTNTGAENNVKTLAKYVGKLLAIDERTPKQNAALRTDLQTLRADIDQVLGIDSTSAKLDQILTLLRGPDPEAALLDRIAAEVHTLYRIAAKPPTAVVTFTHGGTRFTGRLPMPVSILDSDQGWGVAIGELTDAVGEAVADRTGYTCAISTDRPDLVTVTDNGDFSATFGSALAAGTDNAVELPDFATLKATITQPDGGTFDLEDVITVVAGEAVDAAFVFTPPTADAPGG